MARIDLKFLDCTDRTAFIQTIALRTLSNTYENVILINGVSDDGNKFLLWLDKSTAIKFAKTLRTEINKITESEVSNGGQ